MNMVKEVHKGFDFEKNENIEHKAFEEKMKSNKGFDPQTLQFNNMDRNIKGF